MSDITRLNRSGYCSKPILVVMIFYLLMTTSPMCRTEESMPDWLLKDRGRIPTDEGTLPGAWQKAAFYLPNRILDILDLIQIDVGWGWGIHFNGHGTRALQLGFGLSSMNKLGVDGRQFGFFDEGRSELSLLPFSLESYSRDGLVVGNYRDFETATQREQLYNNQRDYFGVGAAACVGIIGVQADVKPTEMVDFITGWAGLDLGNDDHPFVFTRDRIFKWNSSHRDSINRLVLVTSRVVDSRHVGSEARSGVAAYNHRADGEFFLGKIGRKLNAGEDREDELLLNEGLYDIGYDLKQELVDKFTRAYQNYMIDTDIIPVTGHEDQRVLKNIGDEVVLRLPNYLGISRSNNADVLCDLRILEWSIFKNSPGQGLRLRLNVECKIIRYPENEVLVDTSNLVYDIEKETNIQMEQFLEDSSRDVMIETGQAVDILIAQLIDKLMED